MPSTPCQLSSTRPSRSVPSCWLRTIRCSFGPSTALQQQRPGPGRPPAADGRDRAARRAHQRRCRPYRRVRRTRRHPGPARPGPLDPSPAADTDKLVTFVPRADANAVIDAMAAAGAGTIGDYERCTWSTEGIGSFRPLPGARPSIGSVGTIEQVPEVRVEMVLPRSRRGAIVGAAGRASVRGTGLRRVRAGHAAKSVGPGPCRATRGAGAAARVRGPSRERPPTHGCGHPRRRRPRRPDTYRRRAVARATHCSTPCARRPRTAISRLTYATIRRLRRCSSEVQRWSTQRTGQRSGRLTRDAAAGSPTLREAGTTVEAASRRSSPIRGRCRSPPLRGVRAERRARGPATPAGPAGPRFEAGPACPSPSHAARAG